MVEVDAVISRFGGFERRREINKTQHFAAISVDVMGGTAVDLCKLQVDNHPRYNTIALDRAALDSESIRLDGASPIGIRSKEISISKSFSCTRSIKSQLATQNSEDHKINDQTLGTRRRHSKTIGYRLLIRSSYSTDLALGEK